MAIKKFKAIVFFIGDHPPHKYRGITNRLNFEAYCMSKLDAWYINYYDNETKEFFNRKYLKHISNEQ
jgi:hypothetical protein